MHLVKTINRDTLIVWQSNWNDICLSIEQKPNDIVQLFFSIHKTNHKFKHVKTNPYMYFFLFWNWSIDIITIIDKSFSIR